MIGHICGQGFERMLRKLWLCGAMLLLLAAPALAVTEGFESGNLSSLPWVNKGYTTYGAPGSRTWPPSQLVETTDLWTVDSLDKNSGSYSVMSHIDSPDSCALGNGAGDNRYTSLSLTIEVTQAGRVTFAYKTSTETDGTTVYDHLEFYVDGVMKLDAGGENAWTLWNDSAGDLAVGTHTLTWIYFKDDMTCPLAEQNSVWIDDITFPPFVLPSVSCPGSLTIDGHRRADVAMADDGEMVWLEDNLEGFAQIYSNFQWQMTNSNIDFAEPAVNSNGDVVWSQYNAALGINEVWKKPAGAAAQKISTTFDAKSPAINDAGAIVWSEFDGSYWRIYSTTTSGYLSTENFNDSSPDINNLGDIVWSRDTGSGLRIYKRTAVGVVTDVSTGSSAGDDTEPSINGDGAIVWVNTNGTASSLELSRSAGTFETLDTCLGANGLLSRPDIVTNGNSGDVTVVFTEKDLTNGLNYGRMWADWKTDSAVGPLVRWPTASHAGLEKGDYLQVAGNYYYVAAPSDVVDHYGAELAEIDLRRGGLPTGTGSTFLDADLTGPAGAPLRSYSVWPGPGQTAVASTTIHAAILGEIDWANSITTAPAYVRVNGIYYKVISFHYDTSTLSGVGYTSVEVRNCTQTAGGGGYNLGTLPSELMGSVGLPVEFYSGWPGDIIYTLTANTSGTGLGGLWSSDDEVPLVANEFTIAPGLPPQTSSSDYQLPTAGFTTVTLHAVEGENTRFVGWSNSYECPATSLTCAVAMTSNKSITATFRQLVQGTISIDNGTEFTTTHNVTLTLSATSGVPVTTMRFSTDGINWPDVWETYATSWPYALPTVDGTYTVYAQFMDQDGWISESQISDSIVLDYPPTGTVVVNNALDSYANNANVTLTLSCSDPGSGCAGMRVSNDGIFDTESWLASVPATYGWTLSAGDGTKTVHAQFKDGKGTFNTVAINDGIILDTGAPVTTHNAPTGWVNTDVTVTLTPTDAGSGVAATWYCYATTQNCNNFVGGTSFSLPVVPDNTSQVYYFSYYSIDNISNLETPTVNVPVWIDKTAPVTTHNAPANWVNSDVTVTLSPTDSGSGVDKIYSCYGTSTGCVPTLASGPTIALPPVAVGSAQTYYFSYYSVDKAGNVETTMANVPVRIDKIAPVTSHNAPAGWVGTDVTVTLTPLDAHSGISGGAATTRYCVDTANSCDPVATGTAGTSVNVSKPAGQQGSQFVRYYSVDFAGNVEAVKSVEVRIDKTAPVTTHNAPAVWVNSDVTVTLSPTDSGSDVANTYYCYSTATGCSPTTAGTTIALPPVAAGSVQTYYFSYYSVDKVGNVETTTANVPVRIDKIAPVTTHNAPAGWQANDVTVTLTPLDAHSGTSGGSAAMLSCVDTTNTCAPVAGSASVLVDMPAGQFGRKFLRYYSIDFADNAETLKFFTVDIDKQLPAGSIVVNGGNASTRLTAATLTLTCSDGTGSGCSQMRFSNDAVSWSTWESVLATKSWVLTIGEGTKTVYVEYKDVAGNIARLSDTIDLDTTPPVLTLLGDDPYELPLSSSYVEGSYTAIDSHDGNRFAFVSVDNHEVVPTPTLTGTYRVYYSVADLAGNVANVQRTVSVYLSKLAVPTGFAISTSSSSDGSFTLSWNQVGGVAYDIEESTTGTFTNSPTPGMTGIAASSLVLSGKAAGRYYYQIRANKNTNQPSDWVASIPASCEVWVDAPDALTVPAASAGTKIGLSWTASTMPGVTYVLEEAVGPDYSAWVGAANVLNVVGSTVNATVTQTVAGSYRYRVKAIKDTFHESLWATPAQVCIVNPYAPLPSGLNVPALSDGRQVTVGWNGVAGYTYHLQVFNDSGYGIPATATPAEVVTTSTSATLTFTADGSYYYRVRAEKTDYLPSAWVGEPTSGQVALQAVTPLNLRLSTTTSTDGSYTVDWDLTATSGAGYELEETGPAGTVTLPLGAGVTSQVFGNREPGNYSYRIRAVKTPNYDPSNWSASVAVTVTVPAPSALAVSGTSAGQLVTLTWTAPTVVGVPYTTGVTYSVEEATDALFAQNLRVAATGVVETTTTLTYTANGSYYYRVKAVKSPYTDSLWVATATPWSVSPYAPLPATLNVPLNSGDGSITLSWNDLGISGAVYTVQESTSPTFASTAQVYSGAYPVVAPLVLTGRATDTTFYYRVSVTAPNYLPSIGWRDGSNGCYVKLTLPTPGIPVVPATSAGNQITIGWDIAPLAGLTGVTYTLEEYSDYNFTALHQTVAVVDATSTTLTNNTLGAYYYRVKAEKAGYNPSVWASNSGNGCQVVLNAAPPTGLVVPSLSTTGSFTISWTKSTTVGAGYELQETTVQGSFTNPSIFLGNVDRYDVSGKTPANYYYRIRAVIDPYQPSDWVSAGPCVVVIPSTIVSPANNSQLAGASQLFTWANTGASLYQLYVGTTAPGSFNIGLFPASGTTDTSTTVTGLPTNNSTVYVRLYSKFGNTWYYNDYTYTASNAVPATMISPVPASTLQSKSVVFTWNNSGANVYQLYVGTTAPGSYNIGLFPSSPTSGTSTTVSGLPTDGRTVYVRLYSKIGTKWSYYDYTYTALNIAAMTSPANGSTLGGTTQTFTWNNPGASLYQLYVGTTAPGSYNIGMFPNPATSQTSVTVSGLPYNGSTVYVRLFSKVGTTWHYNDYTYTSTAPSAITSPVNGTTFTASSQLFSWRNTGAALYQLYVGTSGPGSSNVGLFPSTPTADTSVTATGLPTDGRTLYVRLYSKFGTTWYSRDYTYKALTISTMVSPASGTVFTGTSHDFTWTNTGAAAYQLYVGVSRPGSTNVGLFPSTPTTATTTTVTGLPNNGCTVYVRLYSKFGLVWYYNDYTYTAFSAAPATMVAPTNQATLTGLTQQFSWSITGATSYQLYVGTTAPGAYDIGLFPSAPTTGSSATVTGLPSDGRTVYVRLYSRIGWGWQYVDYTYTAFTCTPASMIGPANNSTISGASQLFTWTNAGADVYQLYVGTTSPGSFDVGLFPSPATAATSTTLTGLPTDGRTVYVRLYSKFGTSWYYRDYRYISGP